MSDARQIGLDATAPGAGNTVATDTPPLPVELAATHAAPSAKLADGSVAAAETATTTDRLPILAHRVFVATLAIAIVNLTYFVVRFIVSATPPILHETFRGAVAATGHATRALAGPETMLVRTVVVAASFAAMAVLVSARHRREAIVQLMSTTAVIAGQYSISVAVLTSSEPVVAWRALAAALYVALPIGALAMLSLFPNGRAVPRWSLRLLPAALVPFVAQTVVMASARAYSVPLAAAGIAVGAAYLGFQHYRYRRHATLHERYQIKWLIYAGSTFLAIQLVAIVGVLPLIADPTRPAFPFLKVVYEFLIAASYLVAMVVTLLSAARYRLWDVDRVINRTSAYGVVGVLVAAAFGVIYFGLRTALADTLADPALASAACALGLATIVFVVARRRVTRWIDRRFYGIGVDYEALATKAVHAARTTLPTTDRAFASYDELVLLGRGGMGAVYRAHHAEFPLPVALKVMSPSLADDPDAQARFRREAEILDGLRHPNVVPFLASGHDRGLAFIAMAYVQGEDLAATLRRRGRLSLAETSAIVDGVAAALDAAHALGVVHRDVKPANVLLGGELGAPIASRKPLVMDFGVARLASDPTSFTGDASLIGSLPYMAPEQIQNANQVDARADVYALGATAFELIVGRPPFVEPSALAMVMAQLRQPAPDPRAFIPGLPPAAAIALLTALAKAPADRFATAGELANALRDAATS